MVEKNKDSYGHEDLKADIEKLKAVIKDKSAEDNKKAAAEKSKDLEACIGAFEHAVKELESDDKSKDALAHINDDDLDAFLKKPVDDSPFYLQT